MINKIAIPVLLSLITGCASTPEFDTSRVDQSLTPKSATVLSEVEGKTVLWGGTILDTQNLVDSTQIEVLAYPLNSYHRPIQDSNPLGRFIVHYPGYLEPTTYEQGRVVTVLGKISGIREGKVGESTYTYSVIDSEQIHLWSRDSDRSRTSFHFGIGIGM